MSSRELLSQMTTNSVAHKPYILALLHSGGRSSSGATVQALAESSFWSPLLPFQLPEAACLVAVPPCLSVTYIRVCISCSLGFRPAEGLPLCQMIGWTEAAWLSATFA